MITYCVGCRYSRQMFNCKWAQSDKFVNNCWTEIFTELCVNWHLQFASYCFQSYYLLKFGKPNDFFDSLNSVNTINTFRRAFAALRRFELGIRLQGSSCSLEELLLRLSCRFWLLCSFYYSHWTQPLLPAQVKLCRLLLQVSIRLGKCFS